MRWTWKEYFLVELNLRKQKWLVICNNSPQRNVTLSYLKVIRTDTEIHSHSSKYDNFFIIGDCNFETTEEVMKSFYQIHELKDLLNKPTFYKNVENKPPEAIWNQPKLQETIHNKLEITWNYPGTAWNYLKPPETTCN